MRIYQGEFAHNYPSYSFGYTLHAECEAGDVSHAVYDAGFLPASSDPGVHNQCYMARSIRVPLATYTPTSENRRILKKFDGTFETTLLSREELMENKHFQSCFLTYFADRHGQSVMSKERLAGILKTMLPLQGVRYTHEGTPIAYVLEIADEGFAHYWFSCHDMSYAGSSLGMWLMLDGVRRAKDEERDYLYLGTAYGEKGRYKMNITPLEFWDGNTWNTDLTQLKRRTKEDAGREFKG